MILPRARMMLASVLKSMVGLQVRQIAQHAQTDKVFALTVDLGRRVFAALYAELGGGEFLTRLPYSCSTFSLIGRPWQSQPGTYGES